MNNYFLESVILPLVYRLFGMIIAGRSTIIYIFIIIGYVRNLFQKGWGVVTGYKSPMGEVART